VDFALLLVAVESIFFEYFSQKKAGTLPSLKSRIKPTQGAGRPYMHSVKLCYIDKGGTARAPKKADVYDKWQSCFSSFSGRG
jgi:hypothetical protein